MCPSHMVINSTSLPHSQCNPSHLTRPLQIWPCFPAGCQGSTVEPCIVCWLEIEDVKEEEDRIQWIALATFTCIIQGAFEARRLRSECRKSNRLFLTRSQLLPYPRVDTLMRLTALKCISQFEVQVPRVVEHEGHVLVWTTEQLCIYKVIISEEARTALQPTALLGLYSRNLTFHTLGKVTHSHASYIGYRALKVVQNLHIFTPTVSLREFLNKNIELNK